MIYHEIDEFPDEWINVKTIHSQVLYKKYQGQIEDKPQKSIEDLVPQELHEYLTVFSEEAASRFPERKSWDHKILLKKDFKPRKGKIYDLSPEEDILLQEFIEENSKKGYIVFLCIKERNEEEMALSRLPVIKRRNHKGRLSFTSNFQSY